MAKDTKSTPKKSSKPKTPSSKTAAADKTIINTSKTTLPATSDAEISDMLAAVKNDIAGLWSLVKSDATERAVETKDTLEMELKDVLERSEQYITEKPLQSVFIGLGMGVVIGNLFLGD